MSKLVDVVMVKTKGNRSRYVVSQLVKFYFLFSLFLGIDSGYLRTLRRRPRILLTSVCVIISVVNTILPIIPIITDDGDDDFHDYIVKTKPDQVDLNKYSEKLLFGLISIQFVSNSLVSFISNYSLYNFLIDLDKSSKLTLSKEYGCVLILTGTFAVGMFVLKIIVSYASCFIETEIPCGDGGAIVRYVIFIIPSLGTDLVTFELFLIYYFTYRYFKRSLELFKKAEIALEDMQNCYVNIANNLDKIRPRYTALLIIELLVDLPKLIAILWLILVYWKIHMHWTFFAYLFTSPLVIIIQIALPAVMVWFVNSQVESLKLLLNEMLLKGGTPSSECPCLGGNGAVSRLLRYVEARPLDHQLGNVVPTDLRLPIALFNLCTTYFIVLLQFTHLFD